MSTRRIKNDAGGEDSAQVLALALFLMLLAFFIVLTSMSDFEENKVSAVQSSVEDAFASASDIMGATGMPAEVAGDDFGKDSGQAFDEIEGLLKAQIGLISITRDAESGVMSISVPENSVFEDHLNPYGGSKTLASEIAIIINSVKGKSVEFRIQVNAHSDRETLNPTAKVKGLGVFARSMMQKGIAPKAVSIGLIAGKPGYVDLTFDAYRGGDQPHLDLEKQGIAP